MNRYAVRYIVYGKVSECIVNGVDIEDVKQYCAINIKGEICSIDLIEVI